MVIAFAGADVAAQSSADELGETLVRNFITNFIKLHGIFDL